MGLPLPAQDGSLQELDEQITTLMRCQPLPEADVKALCDKAREILVSELIRDLRRSCTSCCKRCQAQQQLGPIGLHAEEIIQDSTLSQKAV